VEEPVEVDLPILRIGSTYIITIQLYEDEAELEPLNLEEYEVELSVGPGRQFTETKNLTVEDKTGTIELRLQEAEAEELFMGGPEQWVYRYSLWLSTEAEGSPERFEILTGGLQVNRS
jgi:hypothetical protein